MLSHSSGRRYDTTGHWGMCKEGRATTTKKKGSTYRKQFLYVVGACSYNFNTTYGLERPNHKSVTKSGTSQGNIRRHKRRNAQILSLAYIAMHTISVQ